MQKITKEDLENRVEILNTRCRANNINKIYEIGYRNGFTYLDQQSNTVKDCIEGGSSAGSKRQIYDRINVVINVLK